MTLLKPRGKMITLAVAVLLGASFAAKASLTLQLKDVGSYSQGGVSATLNGSGTILTADLSVGVYGFSKDGAGPPWWYSVCLSPLGRLDWGSHTYDQLSFAAANPGQYPTAWAYSGTDYWGIQNANYLWLTYKDTVIGSSDDQKNRGQGLALAVLKALYDSTGYGAYTTGSGSKFVPSFGSTGSETYYDEYLLGLDDATVQLYEGDVLRGQLKDQYGQQQEFLMIGSPVPEPTTLIAGALLLLPFGASTLRILRKTRVA